MRARVSWLDIDERLYIEPENISLSYYNEGFAAKRYGR